MGGAGSGAKKREVFVLREGAEGEERNESLENSPLFAGLSGDDAKRLDSIMVIRVGPVEEGTVGKILPGDGQEEIAKKWGGGKYRCIARDGKGKPIKGGFETIEIAGEPKLKSRLAQVEYRRQIGEDAPTATASGPAALDVFAILSKQADDQRAVFERRQVEADAQHKRDMDRIREEAAIRERERVATEERREKERREDDERRRKEDDAREARERRFTEEARLRDREFFAAMQKQSATKDPTESLLLGIRLAKDLGGGSGEEQSPWGAIGSMIAGAITKAVAAAQAAPAATPAPRPAAAAAPREIPPKKAEGVTLEGDLADKTKIAIGKLKAIGANPEEVFAQMLDELARRADAEAAKKAKAAEPVEPPPAPATPPLEPPKVTSEAVSGTP